MDQLEVIVVDDVSELPVSAETIHGQVVQVQRHAHPLDGATSKSNGAARAQGRRIAILGDDAPYGEKFLSCLQRRVTGRSNTDVCIVDAVWSGEGNAPAISEESDRGATWAVIGQTRHRKAEFDLVVFADGIAQELIGSTPTQFQRPDVRHAALQRVGLSNADCLLWD